MVVHSAQSGDILNYYSTQFGERLLFSGVWMRKFSITVRIVIILTQFLKLPALYIDVVVVYWHHALYHLQLTKLHASAVYAFQYVTMPFEDGNK